MPPKGYTSITIRPKLKEKLNRLLKLEKEITGIEYRNYQDLIEKLIDKRIFELERELRMRRAAEAEGVVREE